MEQRQADLSFAKQFVAIRRSQTYFSKLRRKGYGLTRHEDDRFHQAVLEEFKADLRS